MKQEIRDIITRVLEGISTTEDRIRLKTWLKEDTQNRKELEKMESMYNALDIINNQDFFDKENAYKKFHQNYINKQDIRPVKFYFLRIAAAVLITFGISFLTWIITKNTVTDNAVSYFELITPKGSHTQLVLTDGTKVWLNANSKLRYPNKFNKKDRTVYLEGEAYFNVKKDPQHPFIVNTSDINIKALGTSFNVKAYPDEGTIETTLINGLVVIEGNKTGQKNNTLIKLAPSQKATFIKKAGQLMLTDMEKRHLKETKTELQPLHREKERLIVTNKVNTEIYTSWIDNRLVFENETFESIAKKLERRYGATILFKENEAKKFRFSGKFPEISIDRALKALQFASPFNYEITQDTIYIK